MLRNRGRAYLLLIHPGILVIHITALIRSWLEPGSASMQFDAVGCRRNDGMTVTVRLGCRFTMEGWVLLLLLLLLVTLRMFMWVESGGHIGIAV